MESETTFHSCRLELSYGFFEIVIDTGHQWYLHAEHWSLMHDQIQIHEICEEQYRELQNKSQFIDEKYLNDHIF